MEVQSTPNTANLSVNGAYSSFTFGPYNIRFRTSSKLKAYNKIKKWDNGYIVVDATYSGFDSPVEEYIDLVPILENLYFDPSAFLQPIKEVVLA